MMQFERTGCLDAIENLQTTCPNNQEIFDKVQELLLWQNEQVESVINDQVAQVSTNNMASF